MILCQQRFDNTRPFDTGQPPIEPLVFDLKAFVVDSKAMQDRDAFGIVMWPLRDAMVIEQQNLLIARS